MISYILKYDWERSKDEIKGNISKGILSVSHIFGFTFYCLSDYQLNNNELEYIVIKCFLWFVYFIISLVCLVAVEVHLKKKIVDDGFAKLGNVFNNKTVLGTVEFIGIFVIFFVIYAILQDTYTTTFVTDIKIACLIIPI